MVALAHRRSVVLASISTSVLIIIMGTALLWPHHEHGASLPRLTSHDHRRMHSSEGHKEGLEGGTEHADSHVEQVHHEHHEKAKAPVPSSQEQADHAEAHGEHGGHAEHEEHAGHEEHKVSPIAFTVAVLIAAFLFADVGLLYLINWRDENVRSSIYKMLSATMSIFLAVTLNAALFGFILEQVLGGGFDEGTVGFRLDVHAIVYQIPFVSLPLAWEFFVGMGIFLGAFALINLLCFRMRKSKYLYPIRIIGGHITAFAGITTFGTLQIEAGTHSESLKHHHYVVIVTALVVLVALRVLSKQWRNKMGNGQVTLEENTSSNADAPKTVAEDDEWRVQVCEAEDDATCLILSFLMSQVAIWKITGNLESLHGHGPEELHPASDVQHMLKYCGYATASLAVTNFAQSWDRMSWLKDVLSYTSDPDDPTQGYLRIMSNLQMISAMSMSWSALVAGYWAMQLVLHDTLLSSPEMVKVANAGALTILVIVLMISLDKIADWFQSSARKRHNSPESLDQVHKHAERIIRNLIEAYGLLVGLCWEKATDAAIEVIIEGDEMFASHKVKSKCFFATLMMVFMFTAWVKYIVPSAQKPTKLHKADMMLEDGQAKCLDSEELKDTAHIIISRMKSQLDKNDKLASLLKGELDTYMQARNTVPDASQRSLLLEPGSQ